MYLSLKYVKDILDWDGKKPFLHITHCEINLRGMNGVDLEFIPYHNVHIPGKAKKSRVMVFVILTFCPLQKM